MQSGAASRPEKGQLVPSVGERVPRATRVRFVVSVFARERSNHADERIGLSPRCVSSQGDQLSARQKGRRLPVFEAACPSRLSRKLWPFDPRSARYDGLMIRGLMSRRGPISPLLPAVMSITIISTAIISRDLAAAIKPPPASRRASPTARDVDGRDLAVVGLIRPVIRLEPKSDLATCRGAA